MYGFIGIEISVIVLILLCLAAPFLQPQNVFCLAYLLINVNGFFLVVKYRKSGNFHVEIIHVVNSHVNLFSWVYGTHENILT